MDEVVWRSLIDHGLTLRSASADTLVLAPPDQPDRSTAFTVRTFTRRVGPQDVTELVSTSRERRPSAGAGPRPHPLVVAPSLSAEAISRLDGAGWSWISVRPDGQVEATLLFGSRHLRLGVDGPAPVAPGRRGPHPWGRLTLVRHLLTGAPQTQADLARSADVGQSRVSQILTELQTAGWVTRRGGRPSSWQVSDWEALLDWWLDTYPGPGGVSSHWRGLEPVPDQARVACAVLEGSQSHDRPSSRVIVAGDVAADAYAPWRAPRRALVYASTVVDLAGAGFTPVAVEDATLTVTAPDDPGIWPTGQVAALAHHLHPGSVVPLADPFQVLADVTRDKSLDADQAAQRLRSVLQHGVGRPEVPTR